MASSIYELAELCFGQIYPNPTAQNAVTLEEFVSSAKIEYGASMYIFSKQEKASEGGFEIPSELLIETELDVVNNEIDLSGLNVLTALTGDEWLRKVGGMECGCRYVKSSLNKELTLCDDDSIGNARVYYVQGNKIKLPLGAHKKSLPIVYATSGSDLDPDAVQVNDYIASKVREKLTALYGQRLPEDKTQNANSNN